jgi:hypothetical protein
MTNLPSILKSAALILGSLALALYLLRRLLVLNRNAAHGSRLTSMNLSKAAHAISYSAVLIAALFLLTGGAMSLADELNYNLKGRPLANVLHTINPRTY